MSTNNDVTGRCVLTVTTTRLEITLEDGEVKLRFTCFKQVTESGLQRTMTALAARRRIA